MGPGLPCRGTPPRCWDTSRLGVGGGPATLGRSELHPQGRRPPARAEDVTPRGPACGVWGACPQAPSVGGPGMAGLAQRAARDLDVKPVQYREPSNTAVLASPGETGLLWAPSICPSAVRVPRSLEEAGRTVPFLAGKGGRQSLRADSEACKKAQLGPGQHEPSASAPCARRTEHTGRAVG